MLQLKVNVVKAKLVEKGYSHKRVAEKIGMTENTFARKLNSYWSYQFKLNEFLKLMDLLEVKPGQISNFFGNTENNS